MRKRYIVWASVTVVALAIVLGALYALLLPGLSSARIEPPAAEIVVATWLLHQSVPAAAKVNANPLGAHPADVTAGQDLYRQKCELCHAYDGSGKTNLGGGEYPRPPALRSATVMAMPDGEIFYHIRNGIRNTAMPAWGLPDRQIWQLVTYIRNLPKVAQLTPEAMQVGEGSELENLLMKARQDTARFCCGI
jgi:mono/diheme cytochrome c family protein